MVVFATVPLIDIMQTTFSTAFGLQPHHDIDMAKYRKCSQNSLLSQHGINLLANPVPSITFLPQIIIFS